MNTLHATQALAHKAASAHNHSCLAHHTTSNRAVLLPHWHATPTFGQCAANPTSRRDGGVLVRPALHAGRSGATVLAASTLIREREQLHQGQHRESRAEAVEEGVHTDIPLKRRIVPADAEDDLAYLQQLQFELEGCVDRRTEAPQVHFVTWRCIWSCDRIGGVLSH